MSPLSVFFFLNLDKNSFVLMHYDFLLQLCNLGGLAE